MIFIERDSPLSAEEILEKLEILRQTVETEDDNFVRKALHQAVPTFYAPEEINCRAAHAQEMQMSTK